MDEKLRLSLLADIIAAIQPGKRECPHGSEPFRTEMCHVWVHFYTKRGREICDLELPKAMDCLINNVWHFEDFNLTDAASIKIKIH